MMAASRNFEFEINTFFQLVTLPSEASETQ